MTKQQTFVNVTDNEKARVRMPDGRIVDSWHPSQPLKDGCVQISEDEWRAIANARALADVALEAPAVAPTITPPIEPTE